MSRSGSPGLEVKDWRSRTRKSKTGGPGLGVQDWRSITESPGLMFQNWRSRMRKSRTRGLGLEDRAIKITQSVDPPTGLMNKIMLVWSHHFGWKGTPMWLSEPL